MIEIRWLILTILMIYTKKKTDTFFPGNNMIVAGITPLTI